MSKELIERVAKAMLDAASENKEHMLFMSLSWWRNQARVAIAEHEAAREEAQDAEDERMYTEFHK